MRVFFEVLLQKTRHSLRRAGLAYPARRPVQPHVQRAVILTLEQHFLSYLPLVTTITCDNIDSEKFTLKIFLHAE